MSSNLRDVEQARGAWSFLSVFPVASRFVMAKRLGPCTSVKGFLSKEMFMVRERSLKSVVCRYLPSARVYVLWEDSARVGSPGFPSIVDVSFEDMDVEAFVMGYGVEARALMSEEDGWCYLMMPTQNGEPIEDVGPWPSMQRLVDAGMAAEAFLRLSQVSTGRFHYRGEAVVGGSEPESVMERLKCVEDFSDCKCRVHQKPMALVQGAVVGCSQKKVGDHPVVRAAAEGVHIYCHAEPTVRRKDREGLEEMAKVKGRGKNGQFSAYESLDVLASVAELESFGTPVSAFGRGYCYLVGVRPGFRWRVARLLGPNPLCIDVMAAMEVFGSARFRRQALVEVANGYYHVTVDKSKKGEDSGAGKALWDAFALAVSSGAGARVGLGSRADERLVELFQSCGVGVSVERVHAFGLHYALTPAAELGAEEQREKRMLEALGDAALTMVLAEGCEAEHRTAQAYQELRGRCTNNRELTRVFVESGLADSLGWAEHVQGSVTSAKALEGLLGAVYKAGGLGDVRGCVSGMGFGGLTSSFG